MSNKFVKTFKDMVLNFEESKMSKWSKFKFWFSIYVWEAYMPGWLTSHWYGVRPFYYNQISSRIWPRQKWLTKTIPRTWADKVTLIPDLLYTCIIHYVDDDGEDCFGTIIIDREPYKTELLECYNWAKTGRKEFEEKVNQALPKTDSWESFFKEPDENGYRIMFSCEDRTGKTHEELYGEHNRLEKEFYQLDEKYMTWIVKNVRTLWC